MNTMAVFPYHLFSNNSSKKKKSLDQQTENRLLTHVIVITGWEMLLLLFQLMKEFYLQYFFVPIQKIFF